MKVSTERLLTIAILLLTCGLVWVVAGTLQQHVTEAGETAPKFSIVTDSGRTVTRSDFGGKLLVLNFWATWCETCIVELPSLNQFAQQYKDQGVVVLGVSVDTNSKIYQNFVKSGRVAFDTAYDPDAKIATSYGTVQFPETYLIDRNGKVLEKVISDQNWMAPDFLQRVKTMLADDRG